MLCNDDHEFNQFLCNLPPSIEPFYITCYHLSNDFIQYINCHNIFLLFLLILKLPNNANAPGSFLCKILANTDYIQSSFCKRKLSGLNTMRSTAC